ncbi:hypothetical protein PBRA_000804, partial [Plasmodiophora brassicae]
LTHLLAIAMAWTVVVALAVVAGYIEAARATPDWTTMSCTANAALIASYNSLTWDIQYQRIGNGTMTIYSSDDRFEHPATIECKDAMPDPLMVYEPRDECLYYSYYNRFGKAQWSKYCLGKMSQDGYAIERLCHGASGEVYMATVNPKTTQGVIVILFASEELLSRSGIWTNDWSKRVLKMADLVKDNCPEAAPGKTAAHQGWWNPLRHCFGCR